MPAQLTDPDIVLRLAAAGIVRIHEPLVALLADETVDLDAALRVGEGRLRERYSFDLSLEVALAFAETLCVEPGSAFQPMVEAGVLGGSIPLGTASTWALCHGGLLALRSYSLVPDTLCCGLGGEPLRRVVEAPRLLGGEYVVECCQTTRWHTTITCRVDLLPVADAIALALAKRFSNSAAAGSPEANP